MWCWILLEAVGLLLIEALMNKRQGIHIDLNPLSIFWMEALLSKIEVHALQQQGAEIIEQFKKSIKKITLKEMTEFFTRKPSSALQRSR